MTKARDIMTGGAECVQARETVLDAARKMIEALSTDLASGPPADAPGCAVTSAHPGADARHRMYIPRSE